MMDKKIFKDVELLWKYLVDITNLQKSDVILILGGHDISVGTCAIEVFKRGFSDIIVVSGGPYNLPDSKLENPKVTEADIIYQELIYGGIPKEHILLEKESSNTSENFEYSRLKISDRIKSFSSYIIVSKPYALKRAGLTGRKIWPGKKQFRYCITTSLHDYQKQKINYKKQINMMIGEIERLKVYPTFGFFDEVFIPEYVFNATSRLKRKGFSGRPF